MRDFWPFQNQPLSKTLQRNYFFMRCENMDEKTRKLI